MTALAPLAIGPTLRIDNRVRIALETLGMLEPEVRERLELAFTHVNPAKKKLEAMAKNATGKKKMAFSFALKKAPSTIATWKVEGDDFTVPRGGLSVVREVLKAHGLSWVYDDQRTEGKIGVGPGWDALKRLEHRPAPQAPDGGALRWYQDEGARAAMERQNCLLRAPTGSGKTSTLIGVIARVRLPTLVVVDSSELMRQWRVRLVAELGLNEGDIGQVGGGEHRIKPITIGMRQSLVKYARGLSHTFGLVVVDEVHRAAASTFMDVVDAFASFYRIGASADETRKDGLECLVYDVFGDVAHEVTREQLVEEGSVLDVEIRMVPTEFRAPWYVQQRMQGQPDHNRLLEEMTVDPYRNELVLELMHKALEVGEQVLMLTHRVEHATFFASMAEDWGLMLGGAENKVVRERAIDGMRGGVERAAAGTIQAMGQAIDLPSVGRGILATPTGANRQLFGQIRGRFCRPGAGKTAILYVLWDQWVSGAAPLERMLKWNRVVKVRADGEWVDGRVFLKQWKAEQHAQASIDELGDA